MQQDIPVKPNTAEPVEDPFKLVEQAAVQYRQENFETALDFLVRAETLAREIKRPEALVVIFSMAGNVFSGMGEFERALRYFEKSLEVIKMFEAEEEREAEDESEAEEKREVEAKVEVECDEETEAGVEFEEESEGEVESIFIEWSASNEGKIGNLLFRLGRLDEAEKRLKMALGLYEQLLESEPGDVQFLSTSAKIRDSLGKVLSEKGQKDEACVYYTEAANIRRDLSKSEDEE